MAPPLTDYLHGLRRLWWVPVITILIGLGLGLFAASTARSTTETTRGNVLFTFRIDDPGDDSAGSARQVEEQVAKSRLTGYVQLARTSARVREILAAAGIEQPPTTLSPTGGFRDGSARALIAESETGIVEVHVMNEDLSQSEADQLVTDLTKEVAGRSLALDAQQVTPSLLPDPLITPPQPFSVPASPPTQLGVPLLLMALLGFGLVYVIVWRQGRIYARRDIEERVGARVLGDLRGRPADAPAIVLALTKGRESGTRALIVPVPGAAATASAGLGDALAAAGRDLGLVVSRIAAETSLAAPVGVTVAVDPGGAPPASAGAALTVFEATDGLNAQALLAAGAVDIVALAVAYGTTTYRDLNAAGRTLAEVTDADVAVIGVHAQPVK